MQFQLLDDDSYFCVAKLSQAELAILLAYAMIEAQKNIQLAESKRVMQICTALLGFITDPHGYSVNPGCRVCGLTKKYSGCTCEEIR